MKVLLALMCFVASAVAETWLEAFSRMPLPPKTLINRENCMQVMLQSFQSNGVVRALAFLPAVSDDFYLISRDKPQLNIKAANLRDAVTALTNATDMRVTLWGDFLLLHLAREPINLHVETTHALNTTRLKGTRTPDNILWIDAHWDKIQPKLTALTQLRVLPGTDSRQSWHFGRHNVAAHHVSGWDVVALTALSGGTRAAIERRRIVFSEQRVAF
jgi:hypothetical protein